MAASFTLSPTSGPAGTTIFVKATGTSTAWVRATRFTLYGGTGVYLTDQVVDQVGQTATFKLYAGTAAATITVGDTMDAATATFTVTANPTFTLSPAASPLGLTVQVTMTGLATSWTGSTTVSVSGGTGASIVAGTTVVNAAAQTITFSLKVGTATGTLTISNNTDSATASYTAQTSPYTKLTRLPSGLILDSAGNLMVNSGTTADSTANVPTGAANTVVSSSPGRLATAIVTTAGTGTGGVQFFDNATTNSGLVVGYIPATVAVGTMYTFDMPVANGITVQNVASGPVLTVSYQ